MADLDYTKHPGGQTATDQLVELCRIDADKRVLDVGCGVGVTPCNLARSCGAEVVGVDLRARMINRARERARQRELGLKRLALAWWRALLMGLRSPEYRRLPKGALSDPKELLKYWRYGIYVGRK